MKKAMIIQPRSGGIQRYQINQARSRAIKALNKQGYELYEPFSDGSSDDELTNESLLALSRSIATMAEVSLVYCCLGWDRVRGCRIEHSIARDFDLDIVYEKRRNG